MMRTAVGSYDPANGQYSAFLLNTTSAEEVTVEKIDSLAETAQTDLQSALTIIGIVQKYINKNDLIGAIFDALQRNVNTDYKLVYRKVGEQKRQIKRLERAKAVIDAFNDSIDLRGLLRSAVPLVYAEGTYVACLRGGEDGYIVDYYPLGVVEISDYLVNGRPVVLVNVTTLEKALKKTMLFDRRRKALFFKTIEEEIQNNYPDEVYQAYKNKETYAKLDSRYTGVVRIGNMNRKYGLSPIFRALAPVLMLETLDKADRTNAKARAKKIIHQTLHEKLMGEDGSKMGYQEMAFAHNNLMQAWRQPTVVTTIPPYVKSTEYVEPSVDIDGGLPQ